MGDEGLVDEDGGKTGENGASSIRESMCRMWNIVGALTPDADFPRSAAMRPFQQQHANSRSLNAP
eukprot:1630272-Rhodomonas_salina.3